MIKLLPRAFSTYCNGNVFGGEHAKPEKTQGGTYSLFGDFDAITCQAADCIEMFYNPKRKQARIGMLSPADFERQQKVHQEGV